MVKLLQVGLLLKFHELDRNDGANDLSTRPDPHCEEQPSNQKEGGSGISPFPSASSAVNNSAVVGEGLDLLLCFRPTHFWIGFVGRFIT